MSGAPRVVGLHHVLLAMPPGGEDAADAFYGGLLGLTAVPKPGNLAVRGGRWYTTEGTEVHLGVDPEHHAARKAHPAFLVEGLPALRARLEASGAEVSDDEPLEGFDRCYVRDPFGNRIELLEPR